MKYWSTSGYIVFVTTMEYKAYKIFYKIKFDFQYIGNNPLSIYIYMYIFVPPNIVYIGKPVYI